MLRVLGLMSGTSIDSIDVAVCAIRPDTDREGGLVMQFEGYSQQPFSPLLRSELLEVFRYAAAPLDSLTRLNFALGEAFGRAAVDGVAALGHEMGDIDLIASHGQTIYHLIESERRATLQFGEPALIAAITGRTVVANFRPADMAVGGQGAPLVSLFDVLLGADDGLVRALQNIGGIANVTFLLPDGSIAFDTGPGVMAINHAARHFSNGTRQFDGDGEMAARGKVDEDLLAEALAHPYFSTSPPKSTGREMFGDRFTDALLHRAAERHLSPPDVMATFTALTAESIALAYRRFGPSPIDEIILSGGGVKNPTLLTELRKRLPGPQLVSHDATGIPAEAKEAIAFALLGYETVHGRPGNVPRCTGASRQVILGQLVPGENFTQFIRHLSGEERQWSQTRSLRLMP